MSDPVEIVCGQFYDVWGDEERERVREVLAAMCSDGWRIVRTDPADPDYMGDEVQVVEEWLP